MPPDFTPTEGKTTSKKNGAAATPNTGQIAAKIAALIGGDNFGNGPRAALRRMAPTDLAEPALQRLLAAEVPDDWLNGRGMADWGLIIHVLALCGAGPQGGTPKFGAGLQQANYSESRLARLLQADRAQLNIQLPRACRLLATKGVALHPADVANFVRGVSSPDHTHADAVRTRIARDFYQAERKSAASQTISQD